MLQGLYTGKILAPNLTSHTIMALLSRTSLNHSTTVRSMLLKKHMGGIGIRNPSIVYRTARLCHLFKMLNHQDENLRFTARNSLEIDFNK